MSKPVENNTNSKGCHSKINLSMKMKTQGMI